MAFSTKDLVATRVCGGVLFVYAAYLAGGAIRGMVTGKIRSPNRWGAGWSTILRSDDPLGFWIQVGLNCVCTAVLVWVGLMGWMWF